MKNYYHSKTNTKYFAEVKMVRNGIEFTARSNDLDSYAVAILEMEVMEMAAGKDLVSSKVQSTTVTTSKSVRHFEPHEVSPF